MVYVYAMVWVWSYGDPLSVAAATKVRDRVPVTVA